MSFYQSSKPGVEIDADKNHLETISSQETAEIQSWDQEFIRKTATPKEKTTEERFHGTDTRNCVEK